MSATGKAPDRRVLHVMRMSGVSGAERHLLELTATMNRLGWKADVLIPTPDPAALEPLVDQFRAGGARVEMQRMPRDLSPALLRRLASLLRSGDYDLAHAHLVHADWHLGVASLLAPEVPIVSSKHNHDPFRRRRSFRLAEEATIRRYTQVIAISDSLGEFTTRWARRPTVTVRYGLSCPPQLDPRPAEVEPRLLAVGRLEPQKGFDVLLEAMRSVVESVPEASLAIAGEGSERERLERLIDELGLAASVRLLGRREDVSRLLAGSFAFVHPARWEGFGLVLLEAMREGVPVIATRVGAIPEVVSEDATALLVPAEDPDRLAAAVVRLLRDPGLAATMGRAGFERLRNRFSPQRMGEEVARVYELALSGSPR